MNIIAIDEWNQDGLFLRGSMPEKIVCMFAFLYDFTGEKIRNNDGYTTIWEENTEVRSAEVGSQFKLDLHFIPSFDIDYANTFLLNTID